MDYLADDALQLWADDNQITDYEVVNKIAEKFLPLFEAAVYENLQRVRERKASE
jgi:hypothetical protein